MTEPTPLEQVRLDMEKRKRVVVGVCAELGNEPHRASDFCADCNVILRYGYNMREEAKREERERIAMSPTFHPGASYNATAKLYTIPAEVLDDD